MPNYRIVENAVLMYALISAFSSLRALAEHYDALGIPHGSRSQNLPSIGRHPIAIERDRDLNRIPSPGPRPHLPRVAPTTHFTPVPGSVFIIMASGPDDDAINADANAIRRSAQTYAASLFGTTAGFGGPMAILAQDAAVPNQVQSYITVNSPNDLAAAIRRLPPRTTFNIALSNHGEENGEMQIGDTGYLPRSTEMQPVWRAFNALNAERVRLGLPPATLDATQCLLGNRNARIEAQFIANATGMAVRAAVNLVSSYEHIGGRVSANANGQILIFTPTPAR